MQLPVWEYKVCWRQKVVPTMVCKIAIHEKLFSKVIFCTNLLKSISCPVLWSLSRCFIIVSPHSLTWATICKQCQQKLDIYLSISVSLSRLLSWLFSRSISFVRFTVYELHRQVLPYCCKSDLDQSQEQIRDHTASCPVPVPPASVWLKLWEWVKGWGGYNNIILRPQQYSMHNRFDYNIINWILLFQTIMQLHIKPIRQWFIS